MRFQKRGSKLNRMMNMHQLKESDSETSFVTSSSLESASQSTVGLLHSSEESKKPNILDRKIYNRQAHIPDLRILKNPKFNFFFHNSEKHVVLPDSVPEEKLRNAKRCD